jgi:NodT family efflux transporter outer membrane factor (OMF) lipoprotein
LLFNDAKLSELVKRTKAENLDLKAAAARVRQSRELLGVSRSGFFPTLDGNAGVTRNRVSKDLANSPGGPPKNPSNTWQTGLDATWELDIFGRVRRGVEAAKADLASQEAALEGVRVSLQGETALAYMELRGFQEQLKVVQANLAAQQETLELTTKRLDAGLATALDVARTEAQVATTRSQLPPLHEGYRRSAYRLAVLVGEEPGALVEELAGEYSIPAITTTPRFSPPADLLRRRPDVREAERVLAAETARIGVRKAELYPRFTISGNLGLQAGRLGDVSTGTSNYWAIGPGVTVPLFNAGALRAQVRAQDARAEAALENYRQTILIAMEETENALTAFAQEQERRAALEAAVAANQRAFNLSRDLFDKGLIDFLDLLDSERTLLSSQSALVESRSRVAQNLVASWKAMGGTWEAPAPTKAEKL